MALTKYVRKPTKVATPVINPAAGDLGDEVAITCATAGALIFYTQDGSTPAQDNPNATLYVGPFEVESGEVRARAFLDPYDASVIAVGYFHTGDILGTPQGDVLSTPEGNPIGIP